jgi:peptide/nickel transport system substrate-binding protein
MMVRKEAPQLAALVREGKLPPVEQRLPKNPPVVAPVERIGKYGGAWRTALLGGADTVWLLRTLNYENLVRWDRAWSKVLPNIAATVEAGPDAREYTFRLREELRWSDGQPFTADDILFWYEDVLLNKELSLGRAPDWMKAGDKVGVVKRLDRHAVQFTFAAPNGLFLLQLASPGGTIPTSYPKHYLQQFHVNYNPGRIEQLAREHNVKNWVELFQLKGTIAPGAPTDARWLNPDLPTLHAWRLTQPYGGNAQRVVAERNPYYFKVDPEGNQLPYLDRVTYDVLQDKETLVLRALNGDIDMMDRHINTLQNKAVFVDNQQRGQYRLFEEVSARMNTGIIALNLTHKDPVKRQLFANRDFRIGLSHAINRQEIIDVVYVSQGEPWQNSPRRESGFYSERLAKQYTEYDVRRAEEHLDKVAPQKGAGGIRLGPDGKPIAFQVEVISALFPDQIDALELVRGYWRKVGIDMQVKVEDRSLFVARREANEHDASIWIGDVGLRDVLLDPHWYLPSGGISAFGIPWSVWYNNPGGAGAKVQPEEPPAAVKEQLQLYDRLKATADERQQAALMRQILEITAEQFYVIGIGLDPNGYGIAKNNFRNVPQSMPAAYEWPTPAASDPCQYFVG